jgi:uncharacterized phage-like protein YoqJ
VVDFAKWLNRPLPPIPQVPRIFGITGHRPTKLDSQQRSPRHTHFDGYARGNPLRRWLRDEMRQKLEHLRAQPTSPPERGHALHQDSYLRQVEWKPTVDYHTLTHLAVSGVALGVDQDFCGVCARLSPELPYVAVVPFPGQEERWPKPSQTVYRAVLDHAVGVVHVSKTQPRDDDEAKRMMGERNDWICCVVDELVAVFDGSFGGTANCVRGYRRLGRQPHIIDPRDYSVAVMPGK